MVELEYRGSHGDVTSTELAVVLHLSRDSIHQLLLPLVRCGWVTAGRGRHGGYRTTKIAPEVPVLSVIALFSRDADRSDRPSTFAPHFIQQLDDRARDTWRRFFSSVTVGDLVADARAEREALSYSI